MSTLLQLSINLSSCLNTPHNYSINKRIIFGSNSSQPMNCCTLSRTKFGAFHIYGLKFSRPISCCSVSRAPGNRLKTGVLRGKLSFLEVGWGKDGILVRGERWKRKKRVVLVRFNEGFGFNGGGNGGGGDNSNNARVLGNLVLAIILTYLTMTGQLGWVLDAVVSLWVLVVLVPVLGLGAFLWWAGQDIVQSSCPNCGNHLQFIKSTLNDEVQLCPFCSQPFSVVGNEFVRDPVKFSNQTTTSGQAFNGFSPRSAKVKDSSAGIVDVEAEIRDAD